MQTNSLFSKIFIRQGHPDFLDLPWDYPLVNWPELCNRLIEVERGTSRHEVVFVSYEAKIYAIKELPPIIGEEEYRILRKLEKLDLPAVKPVGYIQQVKPKERSIIITEYLDSSLPYRSLFMKSGLERYQDRLLGALAILLVRLHLNGFFWGDCSLSNILFRRDAGELQAYLVDAETSKSYSSLSDGQRNHDILIMEENVAGDLYDLSAIVTLPKSLDIYEIGAVIRQRYEQLWNEVTHDEYFDKSETYRIHERIKRLNDMGFTVDEVELKPTGKGNQIKMRTIVTDRNYHRHQLHQLTGIVAEETQAHQMMNEIHQLRLELSEKEQRSIPLSSAGFYWTYEVYFHTIKELGLMHNSKDAPDIYCDLLEHKWHLSKKAGHDVGLKVATDDYKEKILPKRRVMLFNKLFRGYTKEISIDAEKNEAD
ncbi:MAG: DUF4032 domain-containing protein [Promethearchaeota archaeon]